MNRLFLAILFITIILTTGCINENQNSDVTPTQIMTTLKTQAPVAILTTNAVMSTPEIEYECKVGEKAIKSDREVTLTSSFSYLSQSPSRGKIEAPAGKRFLFIDVEIKNIGRSAFFVEPSDFYVMDNEGKSYFERLCSYDYRYDKTGLGYQWLYPGDQCNGKLLFEVPNNTKTLRLNWGDDTGNGGKGFACSWRIE
jgi:hypothetical protein